MHRPLRRFFVAVLLSCFAVGNVSATYNGCAMQTPATQEAQPVMAEPDCASMDDASNKAKTEKHCCFDYSCPKCYSSPLMAAKLEETPAFSWASSLVFADILGITSLMNDGIERPPKYA